MKSKSKIRRNIKLSRYHRLFLFFVMVGIESVMNISSGIFSSATKEIKKQLNLNDTKFGSFGSANSIGRVISSILFGILNQKVSRKWTTIIFVFFHAQFLFTFKLTMNGHILIFIRGLLGLTQTTPSVYVPVWINQFGLSNYKTIQITSVQLFQTIGKLSGQLINLIVGLENWKQGFIFEGIILLIFCFICCIYSEDYFSRSLYPVNKKNNIDNGNVDDEKRKSYITIFLDNDNNIDNEKNNNKGNYFNDLIILLGDKLYFLCLINRCILHGLNTCLHYWLSDFLRTVLYEEQVKVTIYYSIICFLGPLGGLLFNTFLKSIIKDYQSRESSYPIVILQTIASIFSICIGLMNSSLGVSIITIIFLIFNSSVLPLIQGILISCIDKNLSATGFAFASTCTQLLTAGTTPMLYGYINDRYKNRYPRLAMVSIMSMNLISVPLLIILAILRNKKIEKNESEKNNFDNKNDKNEKLNDD